MKAIVRLEYGSADVLELRIPLIMTVLVGLLLPPPVVASAPEELMALFEIDSPPPLDLRIDEASVEDLDGVQCVTVRYRSPARGDVTADLFVPAGEGPFGGILVMHGLSGSFRVAPRKTVRPMATALARLGAVALAIDAPFGRRKGPPLRWDSRDRSEQIQLIRDLRRGIDLLAARDDVDEQRLGYLGVSYGAAMGGLLAGVERRLKTYVLLHGDGGLVAHSTGPEDRGGALDRLSKGKRRAWLAMMGPIEPTRFVGQAAPASLLFINGRRDRKVPPRDARAFQEAGSEPKTVRWDDAGHALTDESMSYALEWIVNALQLDGTPTSAP